MNRLFSHFRTIVPVAVIASFLLALAPQTAAAASLPDDYNVSCHAGVCQLAVSLNEVSPLLKLGAGFVVNAAQENLDFLPDGAGVTVSDDLTLSLPVGEVELLDADLKLSLSPEGQLKSLRGTAQAPFPSLGLFDNAQVLTPALAEVGFDQGANLTHLQAPLVSDHRYLFFTIGSDFAATARRGTGDAAQTFRLSAPAGQVATLIVDVDEPYVFFTGDLSISLDGDSSLLQQAIAAGATPFSWQLLPVGQQGALHLSGAMGREWERSYLELGGGYAVDAGLIGDRLGLDVTPLAVEGLVAISPQGLAVDGLVQSRIQPELLFDGDMALRAFVPFRQTLNDAYVQVDGSVSAPVVRFSKQVEARAEGASLVGLAEKGGAAIAAAQTAITPAATGVAAWTGSAFDQARQSTQTGFGLAAQTYDTVSDGIQDWGAALLQRTPLVQLP